MSELFEVEEMIRNFINREKLSHEMYEKLSKRVEDPKAQETILSLAADELTHARLLEKVLSDKKLEHLGKREPPVRTGPPIRVPEIPEITPQSTVKEVIAFAIHHEDRAVQYYSRYMDVFRDTGLFDLFQRMKREEEGHKERLEQIFVKHYAGRKA